MLQIRKSVYEHNKTGSQTHFLYLRFEVQELDYERLVEIRTMILEQKYESQQIFLIMFLRNLKINQSKLY